MLSEHRFEDIWKFIKHKDGKIHLAIPEMLSELHAIKSEKPLDEGYPFILLAGERRSYNANQIYRDPKWRKVDPHGAMRINPLDATKLDLKDGDKAICQSADKQLEVVVELDDAMRQGVVALPHGYGMVYNGKPVGPALNRLTSRQHCDPLSRTPFHKYVPVNITKVVTPEPLKIPVHKTIAVGS